MTQANPIIGTDKSGLQYRTEDNDGKRALLNHHKGSTAPSYAEAGTMWLDDTATPWLLKMHDGTDWISIGNINATTNEFTSFISGAVLGSASTTVEGLVERATDAEVTTGTDTTRYITPKQLADNLPTNETVKAWINMTGTGTVAINDSFNVSSIVDNGTGNYAINFTTSFANTNYVASGASANTSQPHVVFGYTSVSQLQVLVTNTSNALADTATLTISAHGDQ